MKVKVLVSQKNESKEQIESKIITSSYMKQLNEKISYNILQAENRRELGKKELVYKKNRFLTMEEKKQIALNGEQVPVCIGDSNMNEGPVKYYSKYINKKIKL